MRTFINLGKTQYYISKHRVVGIIDINSEHSKQTMYIAQAKGKLIYATFEKPRSAIITDSDHVVVTSLNPDTLAYRLEGIN